MEWKDPFNPFNSWKGLMYKLHWDAIDRGDLRYAKVLLKAIERNEWPPPIEASVDPFNSCNLNCVWCNSKDVIDRSAMVWMSKKHLFDLCHFFADWGVRYVCFAGGGEPLMHSELPMAMNLCKELGMETSIITNGTLFEGHKHPGFVVQAARWIGVSVDAATATTYRAAKGKDLFAKVLYNISTLTNLRDERNPDCEITFKFLIHSLNQHEIYDAAVIAKQLKCDRIHIRPVAQLYQYEKEEPFDLNLINDQLDAVRELETDEFEVFTVRHKFDDNMHRHLPFDKCRATPFMCMFEANGDVNLCIDRKGSPALRLCSHSDITEVRKMWGSDHHKVLIDAINIDECPKCTFNKYNEIIERAFINDDMCWGFT